MSRVEVATGYTVQSCSAADARADVLDLWQRNLGRATRSRFDWLYHDGPAEICLLLDECKQPVGSIGLMKRTLRVFGREVQAAQTIDLNIDFEHRSFANARLFQQSLERFVRSRAFDLIYAFPQHNARRITSRFGFQRPGSLRRWVKPLRLNAFLQRRLPNPTARQIASFLLDPLLQLHPSSLLRRPQGLQFEVVHRFDARFDRLWERGMQRFPIAGDRSACYLNWRFAESPERLHETVCLTSSDGSLDAYIVYSIHNGLAYVDDFFFATAEHFQWLMAHFVRRMRRLPVSGIVVLYLGSGEAVRVLRRHGFWQRPFGWDAVVQGECSRLSIESDQLYNENNWHLTRADIDTDL